MGGFVVVEEPFGDVPDFWNRTGTASSGTTAARGPAEPGRDQHLSRVVGAQAGHEGGEPVTPLLFCFLRWQHAPELKNTATASMLYVFEQQ